MYKLEYFRTIYEHEKQVGNLGKFKDYLLNNNQNIIRDICTGAIYLPSPLLLDELEWNLDIKDDKVRDIIYQLKITSRKFYNSLVEFAPGGYRTHFAVTSTFLGQKMVYDIMEIWLYYSGRRTRLLCSGVLSSIVLSSRALSSRALSNEVKLLISKVSPLFPNYSNIFKGLYGILGICALFVGWYLCSVFHIESPVVTLLLPATISTITILITYAAERSINLFENADITGDNLLAKRYREFVNNIKQDTA